MAAKKTVAVQLGEFNRVIQLECTQSGVTERERLLLEVRAAYGDRINPTDRLTLQIKDHEWQGMFIDFFGDDIEDRSIFRVLVEKSEVRLSHQFVCMHVTV